MTDKTKLTITSGNKNPLATVSPSRNSPTDPVECCAWANDRRHPDAVATGLYWYPTGNPAKPIELR